LLDHKKQWQQNQKCNPSPALSLAPPPPTAAGGSTTRTCERIHAQTPYCTCCCELQATLHYEEHDSRWLEHFHSLEGSRHTPRLSQLSSSRQPDFAQDAGGSAAIGRRVAASELADVGFNLPVAARRTKHCSKQFVFLVINQFLYISIYLANSDGNTGTMA
jgi:hypothetical protein